MTHQTPPNDFDLLHKAIYKAGCEMADEQGVPHNVLDYPAMFDATRKIYKAVCDAVYVDVDRPAVDAGEED